MDGSDEKFLFINADDFATLAAEHGYVKLKRDEEIVSKDFLRDAGDIASCWLYSGLVPMTEVARVRKVIDIANRLLLVGGSKRK